ncbi:MAG: hypothetical protein WCO33_02475 [bacterium]
MLVNETTFKEGLTENINVQSLTGSNRELTNQSGSESGVKVETPKPLSEDETKSLRQTANLKKREYEATDERVYINSIRNGQGTSSEQDVDTPTSLMVERVSLPDEIGKRFDAHGITKGDQLMSLIHLLNNGIDTSRPFHSMPLRDKKIEDDSYTASGSAGPYDTGGFIILGSPVKSGQDSSMSSGGIKGVLVNREWNGAIPRLKEAYPNVRFIRADEMQVELGKWVNEVDKEELGEK